MTVLVALILAAAASHPCMEDAQKLCQGIQPGGGRIAACLKSHQSDLSAACKEKIAGFREEAKEHREEAHEAMAACKDDAQKLCARVKPGKGRMIRCLKQHQSELSPGCAAALK